MMGTVIRYCRNWIKKELPAQEKAMQCSLKRKGVNAEMTGLVVDGTGHKKVSAILMGLSLLTGLLLFSAGSIAGNVARTSTMDIPVTPPAYGQHQEFVEDMRVKVLGGDVRVTRSYNNDLWYINRRWAPIVEKSSEPVLINTNILILPLNNGYDGPLGLERAGTEYIHTGDGIYQDINNPRYTITRTVTATGSTYRWQDRRGSWIAFDENHRAVQYGDRNNVTVSMTYDAEGRPSGVVDHLGQQVLWYEYNIDGELSAIRDYTNRRVEYAYTNGELTQVTDVLGNIWAYTYDGGRLKTKTDPELRTTTIEYAANGTVSAIRHPDGGATTLRYEYDKTKKLFYQQVKSPGGTVKEVWYDRAGDLVRRDVNGVSELRVEKDGRTRIRTDSAGNATIIELDEWENYTKITYPDGTFISASFDNKYNNLLEETNENGVTTRYEYDNSGNLTAKIEAVGTPFETTTQYTYDPNGYGQVVSVKKLADVNTLAAEVLFEYDNYGNITKKTDPELNVTLYLSHDVMGNVLLERDARLHDWQNEYNAAGWLTRIVSPLPGVETNYTHDKVGNVLTITNPRQKVTTFEYDDKNNLIKKTDAHGKIYRYQYDGDERQSGEINQEGDAASFIYNSTGRVVTVTNPNGDVTVMHYGGDGVRIDQLSRVDYPTFSRLYKYNNRNRNTLVTALLDGDAVVNGFEYDAVGNLTARIDSNGKQTRYDYDQLNRQWKVTDALNDTTTSVYDNRNNITAVTDGNQQLHQFEYDRNNRLNKITRPMGEVTTYVYDEVGNLKEKRDHKGQRTEYIYDEANRQIGAKLYSAADPVNPVQNITFSYDSNDNLIGWSDGTYSATLTYDDLDRKLTETVNYGVFSLGYAYTYYDDGALKTFTGPDNVTYQYTYDNNNQLTSLLIPGQGAITVNDYQWTAPTRITLPGGASKTIQYNGLLNPVDIQVKDPASNILSHLQYSYGKMQHVQEKSTEEGNYLYSYDDVYRLTGSEDSIAENEIFEVDAVGNRTGNAGGSLIWNYNANDELQSTPDTTYTYDDNGNLTQQVGSGGTRNYFYDISNRLVRVEDGNSAVIAEYGYDPFDRRLWKEVAGVRTYYFYSEQGLIGEFDVSGNQLAAYGYAPESLWSTDPLFMKRGGTYYYYHNDHLGTPQKLTAQNGAVVWSAHYSGFGAAALSSGNTVENNLRYPGQYYDAETGWHYNWRRYYDPTTGRYTTVDPIGISGAGNLYAYANANPITYIDPTGECFVAGIALGMAAAKAEAAITGDCFEYGLLDAVVDGVCIGTAYKGIKLGVSATRVGLKKAAAFIGDVADKMKGKLKQWGDKLKCMFNSFTGDTLVHTRGGLKPISEIREGDEVLSLAEWSGEQSYQRVEGIITGEKDYLLFLIHLTNGEIIEATDGHPFQVYGKGWRDANRLEAGDRLYLQDKGLVRIASLEQENRHERVYNLTVANTHTYYVGREGVLVHNSDGMACGLPSVNKAVNSNLPHAVGRAVERGIFPDKESATKGLKDLTESIKKNGFPEGTIPDPAHADRVLVPVGDGGMAAYQVGKNGTAKLKTTLNAK